MKRRNFLNLLAVVPAVPCMGLAEVPIEDATTIEISPEGLQERLEHFMFCLLEQVQIDSNDEGLHLAIVDV